MTSEDKLELKKMKDEIISAVEVMITKSIKNLEEYLEKMNGLRFKNIEDTLERFSEYHKEHYEAEKELEHQITEARGSIMEAVDVKIQTNNTNNKSNIGTFLGIGALLLTIIFNIIGYIITR